MTDFGLARVLRRDFRAGPGPVTSSAHSATWHQSRPRARAPRRSGRGSLYALSAILYELLAGRVPFGPEPSARALVRSAARDAAPAAPGSSGAFHATWKRSASAAWRRIPIGVIPRPLALADDLRRFLEGRPVEARPVGTAAQVARWAVRRPSAALLVAVSFVAAVALVAGTLYYNARLRDALAGGEAREAETAHANRDLQARWSAAEELRSQTRQQKENAERQLEDAERPLRLQLRAAAGVMAQGATARPQTPGRQTRCPPELRDFTWHYFAAQCGLDEREFSAHAKGTSRSRSFPTAPSSAPRRRRQAPLLVAGPTPRARRPVGKARTTARPSGSP